MHDQTNILLALTIIIGVGVLVFVGVLLALAVMALKTRTKVLALIDRVEGVVMPHLGPITAQVHSVVDHVSPKIKKVSDDVTPHIAPMVAQVHSVVDDLSPKVKHMGSNLSAVSDTLRAEAQHITASVGDVVERSHQQAARVDQMLSSTLSGIGHAGAAVQEGLAVPFRHISGVVEGLRVGLSTLRRKERHDSYRPSARVIRNVDPDQL